MMNYLTIFLPLSLMLTSSLAFSYYRNQIPNGYNIPHPCKVNYRWPGVGHQDPKGDGVRNVFGVAFAASGHEWTRSLCQADSDGDGLTNGQELGDPNCSWKPNETPSRTVNISHPGICDPYNSDACKSKNTFVSCELDRFQSCQAINNSNVKTVNLTFPEIQVPASETNYLCFSFDLPKDQDYHIVANEPIISNQKVVHHMLLYGCTKSDDRLEAAPVSCGMGSSKSCKSIIGMWTVGGTGSCYGNHVGFRIGRTGYTRVTLQIHYNNPELNANYKDSSGLRLYYQPIVEGDQDLAVLMVGQENLILPPGQAHVQAEAVCPSSCTSQLVVKPANIIRSGNHMHYLGKSMTVSVYRGGEKLEDLSHDPDYSYDSPIDHIQDKEVILLPGDEIKTTCIYNTLTSSRYTDYGESTSDEMCYGFITFYPRDAIISDECVSYGNYTQCERTSGGPIDGCDWVQFQDFKDPASAKMFQEVTKNCKLDGFCRPECAAVINGLKDHPCLKGTANQWLTENLSTSPEGVNFLGRLRSCPVAESGTDQCRTTSDPNRGDDAAGNLVAKPGILLLISILLFIA